MEFKFNQNINPGCVALYNDKGRVEGKDTLQLYCSGLTCASGNRHEEKSTCITELENTACAPGRCLNPGFPLLPSQLLIELGHIVIPFRLVTRASHWGAEVVLFAERCHLEFATVVSRSVAENGLVTL